MLCYASMIQSLSMVRKEAPKHFIFVASDTDKHRISRPSADAVAKYRLYRGEWGLGSMTRHRKALRPGDRVLIYLSGKRENGRHFIAKCEVSSDVFAVPQGLGQVLDAPDRLGNSPAAFSVALRAVKYFRKPIPIEPLKEKLSFIKQPQSAKWGAFMQGGVILITPKDYQVITERSQNERIASKVQ
jgi:hypothetical protein